MSGPGPASREMEPADIARVLGVYAQRVITPRGSTAVSGLELMTALRPPTKAVQDPADRELGVRPQPRLAGHGADGPGAAGGHPGTPRRRELRLDAAGSSTRRRTSGCGRWTRSPMRSACCPSRSAWTSTRRSSPPRPAWSSACPRPDHFHAPKFNPKIPGSWLVDLSHIELDPRLPSPFTPDGTRPTGPAWYQTHTVAYAQELGYNVAPIEAYLRRETGAVPGPVARPAQDRVRRHPRRPRRHQGPGRPGSSSRRWSSTSRPTRRWPPCSSAIKATVKGGVGKLRERPQGKSYKEGERWPALQRPTWRPDIRAAVISKARVNMHRKLNNMAKMTGLYPLAVLSDCVVYPSPGREPAGLPAVRRVRQAAARRVPPRAHARAWRSWRASSRCCGRST